MNHKTQTPFCKAFLLCNDIYRAEGSGGLVLVGFPMNWENSVFPATKPGAFLIRLSGGEGDYMIEVALHDADDEVVDRAMLPEVVSMGDPEDVQELVLYFSPTFPAPGEYCFFLFANGEVLEVQQFTVRLATDRVMH